MKADPRYDQFLVRETEHWGVYVHENQSYLGRMYIWAKRETLLDLPEVSHNEMLGLMALTTGIKRVLTNLFQPDRFNWLMLGNVTAHCHMHVIPRYAGKRTFHGIEIIDHNWGGPPYPYDHTFRLGEALLADLCAMIKQEFAKPPKR